MAGKAVSIERSDNIAIVRLDRGGKANAMSFAIMDELVTVRNPDNISIPPYRTRLPDPTLDVSEEHHRYRYDDRSQEGRHRDAR